MSGLNQISLRLTIFSLQLQIIQKVNHFYRNVVVLGGLEGDIESPVLDVRLRC